MSDRLFRRRKNGKPDGPWIAWGYDAQGRRWTETTHQLDRKAAERVYAALERRHASPADAAREAATLGQAVALMLAEFAAAVKRGLRSEATRGFYVEKTGHWRRILGDDFRLAALSAADVDRVLTKRREEGATEHTLAKELVALRQVLKRALRAGLWNGNPQAVLPVGHSTEYTPRARWLPLDEVQRLVPELPANDAARLAFALATGARVAEFDRAERRDVIPAPDVGYLVRLRGTKTATSAREVAVVLPETIRLVEYALEHGEGTAGLIFRRQCNVYRTLRAACVRAKIDPCTFNDLRRSCAQWLRRAGVRLEIVAAFLGHATTAMVTRVYGRLDGAGIGAAIVQQTGADRLDSADDSDGSDGAKRLETRASDGGLCGGRTHDQRIKSPTVRSRTKRRVSPLFARPRALTEHQRAAIVQQRERRTKAR